MNIVQRIYTATASFTFAPDKLTYTRSDSYGVHSVQLPYGSIGMDPHIVTERNGMLFTGAILLVLWGLAQTAHALLHGDLWGFVFLIPGPLCFLMHAISGTTVTYLDSDDGEIAIFHDKNHDRIMMEIRVRRKKQLLDWYGNINFANDPEDEIKKFSWLHSQHLITDSELQHIITTIRGATPHEHSDFDDHGLPRQ